MGRHVVYQGIVRTVEFACRNGSIPAREFFEQLSFRDQAKIRCNNKPGFMARHLTRCESV